MVECICVAQYYAGVPEAYKILWLIPVDITAWSILVSKTGCKGKIVQGLVPKVKDTVP